MPIYLGNKEVSGIYLGNKELQSVYLGDKEIWTGNKSIDLGSAKSWSVGNYYRKYNQLTADNFLLVTASSVSGSDSIKPDGVHQEYTNLYDGIQKSYNASTGALNFYTQYDGSSVSTGNVRAVLVPRLDKITYLGFGSSFNVKTYFPTTYQNMTVNNFAMRIIKHFNASGSYGLCKRSGRTGDGYTRYSDSGTFSIVKSYNASTGTLTFYGRSQGTDSYTSDENWDRVCNAYVYASKKPFI